MTRVTVSDGATPDVVAAIVAALRVLSGDDDVTSPEPPASAWRRAARREALRAPRP